MLQFTKAERQVNVLSAAGIASVEGIAMLPVS